MDIKRRKREKCLNCGQHLKLTDNYCAFCGQENNDINVTFSKFIGDFLDNYFALDSKIFRSLKPFLIHPGFLTVQYNIGKRASYIHPLRLYLVISLLYFFILSLMLSAEINFEPLRAAVNSSDNASQQLLDSSIDSVALTMQQMKDKDAVPPLTPNNDKVDLSGFGKEALQYAKDYALSDEALMDSLNIADKSSFKKFMVHQGRKVINGDIKPFVMYAIKNFPIMMFLILPLFALILKLLYIRSNRLYVMHLIHALHLHAYAYFIYGISILLLYYFTNTGYAFWLSFLLVSGYAYLSFLKVYKQGKLKTFYKFFLTGSIYLFCLSVFFMAELVISFFLF